SSAAARPPMGRYGSGWSPISPCGSGLHCARCVPRGGVALRGRASTASEKTASPERALFRRCFGPRRTARPQNRRLLLVRSGADASPSVRQPRWSARFRRVRIGELWSVGGRPHIRQVVRYVGEERPVMFRVLAHEGGAVAAGAL